MIAILYLYSFVTVAAHKLCKLPNIFYLILIVNHPAIGDDQARPGHLNYGNNHVIVY